jgi:alpha-2-macroglobulin
MPSNRIATLIIVGLASLIFGILIGRAGGGSSPMAVTEPTSAESAEGLPLSPRRADAPRADAEPEGFAFLAYRIDTAGDAPAACMVFNKPLDAELDYRPFVEAEPARPIDLAAAGTSLCVNGLSFGQALKLTLKEGLPAADEETLARAEVVTVDFEDRPAYVGFEGSGFILPRLEADGLALQTVNVDQVKVSILRVNDRALVGKNITSGDTSAAGEWSYTWGPDAASDVGVPVYSGKLDVKRETNIAVTTVFPLAEAIGSLQPGAYFIEVSDASVDEPSEPPASARRWIVFTDLALTAYRGDQGMDVVLRSLQSALPVNAARVSLIAENNEVLGTAQSNSFGQARFEAPLLRGEGPLRPKMLMAYGPAGDFAALDLQRLPLDLSGMQVSGRTESGVVDAFAYLDRGIYRPGETAYITALLRDAEAMATTDRPARLILRKPNGLVAAEKRLAVNELGVQGVARWDYVVPRAAARGRWTLSVEVDGVGGVGGTSFQVEDFVPQRIAVEIDADDTTPIRADQRRTLDAETRFLYGAPGAGLRARAEARITLDPAPFKAWSGFSFGLISESFGDEILELGNQTTDGAGRARFVLDPAGRLAEITRPLRIQAVVEVEEPGGRAVAESVRIPYRPRGQYLGIKPQFDGSVGAGEGARFDLIAVDAGGEPVAVNAQWKLIEIDYDYHWYQDRSGGWRWRRTKTTDVVGEGALDLRSSAVTLKIDDFSRRWGNYLLQVQTADGAATEHEFWLGWGRSGDGEIEAPDRLQVVVPDGDTAVGESAEIAISAPYSGQAQIVVATNRILTVNYVELKDGKARLSLPVTESWGEGAYVLVSAFTPRDAVNRPIPRRAVGVGYVPVNLGRRKFELRIEAPEVARPQTSVDIGINAVDGPNREDLWLTLAAVDEGILRLTKFETPDPVEHFFGRKALGIEVYDDYGRLLDPNRAAASALRQGGDQLGGEGLSVVPTQSVVFFNGPVQFDGRGRARVALDLPAFDGELRLMAVAWSRSGLGQGEASMTVRAPVTANVILPRFLAPGDAAQATLSIDNVEGPRGDYVAQVETSGPLAAAQKAFAATLLPGNRSDQGVPLTAAEPGIARLDFTVEGPQDYRLTRGYDIQVRSAFNDIIRVERERLAAGSTYTVIAAAFTGYVPNASEIGVSFSQLPFDASAIYKALSLYPYGCTEQLVSRAFPLLYADELASLSGRDGASAGTRTRIQEVIETLLNRQSSDGAIGLWREGDRNASAWIGAFATDFLSRAKEKGYVVPEEALNRALAALGPVAQENRYQAYYYDYEAFGGGNVTQQHLSYEAAAYAHYVLARHQRTSLDRVRYMFIKDRGKIESPLALGHLGAALQALGDRSRAKETFDLAETRIGFSNRFDYYQSPVRDLAGLIAVAGQAGVSDERIARLSDRLAREQIDPASLSTQEKVHLVLAVNALTKGKGAVAITTNRDQDLASVLGTAAISGGADALTGMSFTNAGEQPVWRTTLVRGPTFAAPPADARNLTAVKAIRTMRGGNVALDDVKQGDRLIVTLTLSPQENRVNPLIVEDLLPAGFEIEAILRPGDGASGADNDVSGPYAFLGEIAAANVAEARDDRFLAAIDVSAKSVTLAYIVRAVTPGRFTLPGVQAVDMYRASVFARTAAGEVSIAAAAP